MEVLNHGVHFQPCAPPPKVEGGAGRSELLLTTRSFWRPGPARSPPSVTLLKRQHCCCHSGTPGDPGAGCQALGSRTKHETKDAPGALVTEKVTGVLELHAGVRTETNAYVYLHIRISYHLTLAPNQNVGPLFRSCYKFRAVAAWAGPCKTSQLRGWGAGMSCRGQGSDSLGRVRVASPGQALRPCPV